MGDDEDAKRLVQLLKPDGARAHLLSLYRQLRRIDSVRGDILDEISSLERALVAPEGTNLPSVGSWKPKVT